MESWKAFCGFLVAILKHWITLLTGGAAIAVLGLWEHQTGASVPWSVYLGLVMALFVIACFLAFKGEFIRANSLQNDLSKAIDLAEKSRFSSEALEELKHNQETTKLALEDLQLSVGRPFPFSAAQKQRFVKYLAEVPLQDRFELRVVHPGLGGSAGPARAFAQAVADAGWNASAQYDALTNPTLRGVVVATSQDVAEGNAGLPREAAIFVAALNEAGVTFAKARSSERVENSYFQMIVAEP
jgi:hypothetical protein